MSRFQSLATRLRLKPETLGMTTLLAFMTALGPLATDMYLPSLPSIQRALQASEPAVQQTLSAYLIGFAGGQILYGPVADRFGRKPVLLASFALYLSGCFACANAGAVWFLIAARVVQAVGAAGPIVLARAIVRDLYEGARAGRELSRMATIMGVTPIAAPTLGGLLQQWFGWPSTFYFSAIMAAVLAACATVLLPETALKPVGQLYGIRQTGRIFSVIAANRAFRTNAAILSLSYGGVFAYLSSATFLLQNGFGFGSVEFGATFGLGASCYVVGATFASRLVALRGISWTLSLGVTMLMVGGLLQLAGMALLPWTPLALILPMMLFLGGTGLTMPQSIAACLEPFPAHAGAASSLAGLAQMSFAALSGLFVAALIQRTPLALPLATAISGTAAFMILRLRREGRKARSAPQISRVDRFS